MPRQQFLRIFLFLFAVLGGCFMMGSPAQRTNDALPEKVAVAIACNAPAREESYLVKVYRLNRNYIWTYLNEDKILKAAGLAAHKIFEIRLDELEVRDGFLVYRQRKFLLQKQMDLGPSTAHSDPSPLPPLPR